MGYTRKSQIAEGKKIPALNEDERIVKTLAAGSGGGGGGGGGSVDLPEAYNYVIIAHSFEPTTESSADFILEAVDGFIYGSFSIEEDAETLDRSIIYVFNEAESELTNVPAFWNNGAEGTVAGLEYLLDLKLNTGNSLNDTLAHKICDILNNPMIVAFTL